MATLDGIVQRLANLSITPAATVTHDPANSPQTWREALEASLFAPKAFDLVKIAAYKPKTAKTATPVPLVVISSEKCDYTVASLARKLNLKEPRHMADEPLLEFFTVDKTACACSCNWCYLVI